MTYQENGGSPWNTSPMAPPNKVRKTSSRSTIDIHTPGVGSPNSSRSHPSNPTSRAATDTILIGSTSMGADSLVVLPLEGRCLALSAGLSVTRNYTEGLLDSMDKTMSRLECLTPCSDYCPWVSRNDKGAGEDINVLYERWLPIEEQLFVTSTHPSLIGSKVINLMVIGGGSWDSEILDDLFEDRDKKLIMDIPLHISQGKDKLNWIYETSGFYSVKITYKLLQKLNGRWHQDEDEQTKLLIKAKQVWERVGIGTAIAAAGASKFLDWCIQSFAAVDAEKRKLLLCQQRDSLISGVMLKNLLSRRLGRVIRQYGCGFIARDHHGMLVEGKTLLFTSTTSLELAESIGVREALSWIKTHGWQDVTLETDRLTVVQALRSSMDMISLFGQVILNCKKLLSDLKTVSVLFVKRSANMVAHNCARASIFYLGCIFDMESVPFDLLPSLVANFDG
uniref:RNase H type-1 domain-containing protein n=1 Tax=Cannabis sativa TaxID=3483 RepID=A0A803P1R5_CANSA